MLLDSSQIFPLIPPILFAFLYTLSREIQKDLEDISGDKAANILTLPIATSESLATKLASFQILLAWFLLPLPVLLKWYHLTFLFAVLPMKLFYGTKNHKNHYDLRFAIPYSFSSNLLKIY